MTASLDDLLSLERITAQSDMPDGARAKLYKVIGLTLKNDDKQQALALEYLQKAILIDKDIGVKKRLNSYYGQCVSKKTIRLKNSVNRVAPACHGGTVIIKG